MSRWEFMRQLEELLYDISPSEREEALQYYNDYFNDAGKDNEWEVMKSLGTPQQVAKTVKDGLSDNLGMGEFTENGFTNSGTVNQNAIIKKTQNTQNTQNTAGNNGNGQSQYNERTGTGTTGSKAEEKDQMPTWAIVLIVCGCVLFSPAIIGLVASAFGILVSLFAVVFSFIFAMALAMIILYIVAVSLAVGGFGCLFEVPIIGVGLIGAALICAAIGMLFMIFTVFLVGTVVPAACQGVAYIWKKIFDKKEVA